eukprot:m.92764 g.92764  ORF g.92764 m.92764 type:complete len:1636 (-) comp21744_c0_seq3:74-4981(-)
MGPAYDTGPNFIGNSRIGVSMNSQATWITNNYFGTGPMLQQNLSNWMYAIELTGGTHCLIGSIYDEIDGNFLFNSPTGIMNVASTYPTWYRRNRYKCGQAIDNDGDGVNPYDPNVLYVNGFTNLRLNAPHILSVSEQGSSYLLEVEFWATSFSSVRFDVYWTDNQTRMGLPAGGMYFFHSETRSYAFTSLHTTTLTFDQSKVPASAHIACSFTVDSLGSSETSPPPLFDLQTCLNFQCNNGTCVDLGGELECVCSAGYNGTVCDQDIDECGAFQPCFAGSTCINTPGSFFCECPPHKVGTLCNITECEAGYFQDGQSCIPITQCTSHEYLLFPATATSDAVCTELTNCTHEQYASVLSTPTSDRVCSELSICGTSEYESLSHTFSSDRKCSALTNCTLVEYQSVDPTGTSDRECSTLTNCTVFEYQSVNPTATSDRGCTAVTECASYQYESLALTSTSDRVCQLLSNCTLMQFEKTVPTPTSDRVCLEFSYCNASLEYEVTAPTGSSDRICATLTTCQIFEFEALAATNTSDRICSQTTLCNPWEFELIPPTATSDRVCDMVSNCSANQFEASPPTNTSNRVCSLLTTCLSSEYQEAYPTSTTDRQCRNLTICGEYTFESSAPTNTSDRICQNIDYCSLSNCSNGATCVSGQGFYTCSCDQGYAGQYCDIVLPCASNPCENGGTCEDGASSFTCTCPEPYVGVRCQESTHPCLFNPCRNGGSCSWDGIEDVVCSCSNGFEGPTCDDNIDDCQSHLCQNGGTCQDGYDSYSCKCLDGFNGVLCDQHTCTVNNLCQNGGTCEDLSEGGITCHCPRFFSGSMCEIESCPDGFDCLKACPSVAIVDFTFLRFPETTSGDSALVQCPSGESNAHVVRHCCGPQHEGFFDGISVCDASSFGNWMEASFADCQVQALQNLSNPEQLAEVDKVSEALVILDNAAAVVQGSQNMLGSADVIRTTTILDHVLDVVAEDFDQNSAAENSSETSHEAALGLLKTVDHLLGTSPLTIANVKQQQSANNELVLVTEKMANLLSDMLKTRGSYLNETQGNVELGSYSEETPNLAEGNEDLLWHHYIGEKLIYSTASTNLTKEFNWIGSVNSTFSDTSSNLDDTSSSNASNSSVLYEFLSTSMRSTVVLEAGFSSPQQEDPSDEVSVGIMLAASTAFFNTSAEQTAAISDMAVSVQAVATSRKSQTKTQLTTFSGFPLEISMSPTLSKEAQSFLCQRYTALNQEKPSHVRAIIHEGTLMFAYKLPTHVAFETATAECSWFSHETSSWSSDGCISSINVTTGKISCQCNHMTNFALLMRPKSSKELAQSEQQEDLARITMIGSVVSIACLAVMVVIIVKFWSKKFILVHHKLLVHLSLALIGLHLTFIAGIENKGETLTCQMVAALLQTFLLVSFFFIACQIYSAYDRFVSLLTWTDLIAKHFTNVCFAGWIIPLIISIITVFAESSDVYGKKSFCWIDMSSTASLGIYLPLAMITAVAIYCMGRIFAVLTDMMNVTVAARSSISFFFLFGVTWSLGFLFLVNNSIALQYVFSILNAMQGIALFYFNMLSDHKILAKMFADSSKSQEGKVSHQALSSIRRNQSIKPPSRRSLNVRNSWKFKAPSALMEEDENEIDTTDAQQSYVVMSPDDPV